MHMRTYFLRKTRMHAVKFIENSKMGHNVPFSIFALGSFSNLKKFFFKRNHKNCTIISWLPRKSVIYIAHVDVSVYFSTYICCMVV